LLSGRKRRRRFGSWREETSDFLRRAAETETSATPAGAGPAQHPNAAVGGVEHVTPAAAPEKAAGPRASGNSAHAGAPNGSAHYDSASTDAGDHAHASGFAERMGELRSLLIGAGLGAMRELGAHRAPTELRPFFVDVVDALTRKMGGEVIHHGNGSSGDAAAEAAGHSNGASSAAL
jgi:hypothetical protein